MREKDIIIDMIKKRVETLEKSKALLEKHTDIPSRQAVHTINMSILEDNKIIDMIDEIISD